MKTLKVIVPFDSKHCSINCVFNRTYNSTCNVRSSQPEKIAREGDLYLRTNYCIENALPSEKLPVDSDTALSKKALQKISEEER